MNDEEIKICLEESKAFLDVAEEIKSKESIVDIGLGADLYPFVVNSAFSCELSLKAILMTQQMSRVYGHDLHTLFQKLDEQDQGAISAKAENELNISLDKVLNEFNNAFVEWRYAYEDSVKGYFLELFKLAKLMLDYAKAIQE